MEPSSSDGKSLFGAYREAPRNKRRFPIRTVVLLAATAGVWFALQRSASQTNIITPWGVRTVHVGMTQPEVKNLLGAPISHYQEGSAECFRHGQPTFDSPSFLLYSLCYQDGKLSHVTSERFAASKVDPESLPKVTDPGAAPSPGNGGATPPAPAANNNVP